MEFKSLHFENDLRMRGGKGECVCLEIEPRQEKEPNDFEASEQDEPSVFIQ